MAKNCGLFSLPPDKSRPKRRRPSYDLINKNHLVQIQGLQGGIARFPPMDLPLFFENF